MKRKNAIDDTNNTSHHGSFAILDLPSSSTTVSVNGVSRVFIGEGQSSTSQSQQLVGISSLPSNQFHLITTKHTSKKHTTNSVSSTVGFVLLMCELNSTNVQSSSWIVARRYDAFTEEVSSNDIMSSSQKIDQITIRNLHTAILNGDTSLMNKIIPYPNFMSGQQDRWNKLTSLISLEHLHKRHKLVHGDKIVGSSFLDNEDRQMNHYIDTNSDETGDTNNDGKEISYPAIPCIQKPENTTQQTSQSHRLFTKTQHKGTARFMELLSPSERTYVFMMNVLSISNDNTTTDPPSSSSSENSLLHKVLNKHYTKRERNWTFLMSDFQLSFVLFLNLGCLSSFEFWRDVICFLSLESATLFNIHHSTRTTTIKSLYRSFLDTLLVQLESIDDGFFEDIEYSGDNFLIPALKRLNSNLLYNSNNEESLSLKMKSISSFMRDRFNLDVSLQYDDIKEDNEDEDDDKHLNLTKNNSHKMKDLHESNLHTSEYDDDEDEDQPVIVPYEEIQASEERMTRTSYTTFNNTTFTDNTTADLNDHSSLMMKKYPLLFAAKTSQEDLLMTCSRVLDEANDVSLVREAADYLVNVEDKNHK